MKVALVSLGCSRTLVDSEVALGGLAREGYTVVPDIVNADVAIVNTCGFIDEAKAESIETILRLCELKKKGKIGAVVVLGCLAQRYGPELQKEIEEADAIIGTNNYADLAKILEPIKVKINAGARRAVTLLRVQPKPHYLLDENTPRYSLTPDYFAYVKISEGCINACSYCVIPQMKGAHRSRAMDSILNEIRLLADQKKLSEINLVGQDTAAYGFDRDRTFQLPRLLDQIAKLDLIPWVRLLYAHPGHVSEELIDVIARHPCLCKYVDFPIEHSHDAMLARMNRGVTRKKMEWGLREFRKKIPDVGIRTTIIVGFPGETEEEFLDLLSFIKEARFDRLGAFKFSAEEGARAFKMDKQIPEELKRERYDAVMAVQQEISRTINEAWIGRETTVLIEEQESGEDGVYRGRTERDAPEVDGQVLVHSGVRLEPGQFVNVQITDALEYDLVGEAKV